MASPNATFTEIVSTTLRNHRREFSDNVSKNNALLNRMTKKGRKRVLDGGYEIVEPLDYAENSTYMRYSGYDPLNISASDVLSAAKYDWKQAAVNVTASGLELRQNAGKEQLINLVESRLTNAMRTLSNNLSQDLYSDGTASNQINGLQAIISDLGTGTVGGINSTTFTFWKSILQSAAAPLQGGGAIVPGATTMLSLMNPLWYELTRGNDKPDLIVSSNDYFGFYEAGLQANQRFMDEDMAAAGFSSLMYKTSPIVHDGGGKGGGVPTAHMYFINTNYLKWVVHRDADMEQLGRRESVNQDAVVIPIILQGNLTCSNRSLQGLIKA